MKSSPILRKCNAGELAALTGVSPGTVSGWINAGMPVVQAASGRRPAEIDPAQAIPWIVNHRAPVGSERERLARAQAIKVEMENAKRRGDLVLAGYLAEVLMSMAADIAARLDGLPGRVATELAGIKSAAEIRVRLLNECRAIRSGFAEHIGKLARVPPDSANGSADPAPAARSKRKRVGKRQSRAADRKLRAGTVSQ